MTQAVVTQSFCRFCPTCCGVEVTVEGDRVVGVRGDRAHPVSRGYTCPKGRALGAFHHHPERLDHPLVRRDGALARASWDAALEDLAARLQAVVGAHGPDAIACYRGQGRSNDAAVAGAERWLYDHVGTHSRYSISTVDAIPALVVAELVTGHPALLPVPDPDARMTILVGTNPMHSHGHLYNVTRPKEQLRAWAQQGELWVIDPRRTETADVATTHLAPRAGSDWLLLAHLVRELLRDGADRAFLAAEAEADGVERLAAAVEPFSLARVVRGTGLEPTQVETLVSATRAAGRVAIATGTGAAFQQAANATIWLAWALAAVTGSLNRPGGMWFNPGWFSRMDASTAPPTDGTPQPGAPSRPELPGRYGERPSVALVDEIEAGNVRALLVVGSNLLTTLPEPERTARALAQLDVLAVLDVVHTPTTAAATHVLPVAGPLERPDVGPAAADMIGIRAYAQFTPAVVPPAAERRSAWRVTAELTQRMGGTLPDGVDPATTSDEAVLELLYGADAERWSALRAAPSAALTPGQPSWDWVRDRLPGGRWRLAPQPLVDQLAALPDPAPEGLLLTARRQLRKLNSQLADGHGLREAPPAEAVVHPDDAAAAGVQSGEQVVVRSAHGSLTLVARTDERASRGVVSLTQGFADANVSRLVSGGEADPLTGMPAMTAVPVAIAPA